MEKQELILKLKNPAIHVMKEKKIIASILIAESICVLYSKNIYQDINRLLNLHNPFAISYNGKYREYRTLEEGIANYITSNQDRFCNLENLFRYGDVLVKDNTLSIAKKNQLKSLIEKYHLYEYDIEAISLLYESKKNIIEIPSRNKNTLYYQKQSNCEPDKIKTTPESILIEEVEKKKKENNKKLEKGQQITLSNVNLYETYDSKIPLRSISGTYYISTDLNKMRNNRCGIVMKKEYIGNDLLLSGYIDVRKIKR